MIDNHHQPRPLSTKTTLRDNWHNVFRMFDCNQGKAKPWTNLHIGAAYFVFFEQCTEILLAGVVTDG
jgi:hypothetical protein